MVESISTLTRLRQLNPHLAERSGVSWPLKLESLMRGEHDFFRGTADLFAVEVARLDAPWRDASIPLVLLHGDVHLGNLGTYQGQGKVGETIHFGLVDFDEAMVGPFELDVLHAATSLRFAAVQERLEVPETMMADAIRALCRSYAAALRKPPSDAALAVRFSLVDRLLKKAKREQLGRFAAKFAAGQPLRFRSTRSKHQNLSDIMEPVEDVTRRQIIDAVWWYIEHGTGTATRERFRFANRDELAEGVLDVVYWTRVASSGSQGLRKYLVLLDQPLVDVREPLILQLKEEPIAAASRANLVPGTSGLERAREVAQASLLMNPLPPWLVGYTHVDGQGFLVKTKDPFGEELSSSDLISPSSVEPMAALIGVLLGRSHRLSWNRSEPNWSTDLAASSIENRAPLIAESSRLLEQSLRTAYVNLCADPTAQSLREQARSFLRAQP